MAAAVKMPLATKKALKDAEPEFKKELDAMTKVMGFPVTFNWSPEGCYAALEGDSCQSDVASGAVQYMAGIREGLERQMKDAMVKAQVVANWTTKNITITCEPESFDGAKYCETHVGEWNGYNGLRFVNGNLDLFTKKGRWANNAHHVGQLDYTKILANAKSDLPLAFLKELRDEAANVQKVKERLAKALGVDAVKWDVEADAKAIFARKEIKDPFTVDQGIRYMNGLAEMFEQRAKDEMVREACQEAFGTKTVSLKCYDNMNGLKGLETHDSYHGVQFLDGQIIVFTQVSNFGCNTHNIYNHDIVKLF